MIKAYITPDHRTCDVDLAQRVCTYNTNIHESTGYSPLFLCNGRHPTLSPTVRRDAENEAIQGKKLKI